MYANILWPDEQLAERKISKMGAHINAQHSLFDEHFSNNPILPGAISLHFCVVAICRIISFSESGKLVFSEIEKVNFIQPIKPYSTINLEILHTVKDQEYLRVFFELNNKNADKFIKGCIKLERIL